MSTLHDSEDGRSMLDLVDKLRKIDKIEKTIPLPQIVVVGQQSSGKSSVLNAISGIQFPIHDGLCTQFPTEIILRREQTVRTKASIRPPSDALAQQRSDCKALEERWQNSQLSDLENIISDAKEVLQLNEKNRYSDASLVLEVSGPDQEHLTLIDLPGFIVSTQNGDTETDITLINDITDRYVFKDRAVVLAVISGKTDFENQLIFEYLKRDDFRRRTLGVITAPDAIESGSRLEDNCIQLIDHDPSNLGYGWHALRNLKSIEVRAGNLDRDTVETQFFQQTGPWKRLDPMCVGSQALKKRLSSILKKKIAGSLPEIQQEVDLKLEQISARLDALGDARESPGELRKYLCSRADTFQDEAAAMLDGSPPSSRGWFSNQKPSLRAYVQSKHEAFAEEMFDKAQTWNLDVNGKDTPERLKQICAGRADGTAFIPHVTVARLFFEEMSQHRSKALPGLLHPNWASEMFRRRSSRWYKIAEAYGDDVYCEISERIYEVVQKLFEEDTADRLLQEIVGPALRERKRLLDEKLKELHHPYELTSIYCVSRRYKELVDALPVPIWESSADFEFTQCCKMLASAEAYYQVAVDVFTENVISLGVEMCLLDKLSTILNHNMFNHMTDEELELVGGESEETKYRRKQLQAEKDQFEEARDHVLPAFNRNRSRPINSLQSPQQKNFNVSSTRRASTENKPYSVEITVATPPTTPGRSPDYKKTTTLAKSTMLDTTTPTRLSSTGYETTPSSSNGSHSGSRHSQLTSSVSSYNGSPAKPATKIRRSSSQGASPGATETRGNLTPVEKAAMESSGQKNESVLPVTSQVDEEL